MASVRGTYSTRRTVLLVLIRVRLYDQEKYDYETTSLRVYEYGISKSVSVPALICTLYPLSVYCSVPAAVRYSYEYGTVVRVAPLTSVIFAIVTAALLACAHNVLGSSKAPGTEEKHRKNTVGVLLRFRSLLEQVRCSPGAAAPPALFPCPSHLSGAGLICFPCCYPTSTGQAENFQIKSNDE